MIVYLLKRRDAHHARRFDIKYEQYQRFLNKLDEIAESSTNAFHSEFGPLIAATLPRILSGDISENGVLIELNDGIQNLTGRIQKAYSQAKSELNGIRLVCSDSLLPLIQEFTEIYDRQFQRATVLMDKWQEMTPDQLRGSIPAEAVADDNRLKEIQAELLKQMRTELGLR